MPPVKVEAIDGNGWVFTTVTATVFLGGCYYTFAAWTNPGPLTDRLTLTVITACAGLTLPFAIRRIRLARRQRQRRAEVLATGLRAIATVKAVTQIHPGGEAHDPAVRIMLRVMTPNGRSCSAWANYELPIPMIAALRPGTQLPVVVDVDDPRSVVIDWDNYREGAESELPEVIDLLDRGELVAAVKAYRDLTGAGLKEAKDAVDRMATRRRE